MVIFWVFLREISRIDFFFHLLRFRMSLFRLELYFRSSRRVVMR